MIKNSFSYEPAYPTPSSGDPFLMSASSDAVRERIDAFHEELSIWLAPYEVKVTRIGDTAIVETTLSKEVCDDIVRKLMMALGIHQKR